MTFRAVLELGGKTATGICVPDEVVASFGRGKRVPVRATLNGYTYRTTVASMGGRFFIPVAAEVRDAAGVKALEEVEVTLEVDDEPREVEVPEDLAAALAGRGLRGVFDKLSYTLRKEHVRSLNDAKSEETRRRRLEKVLGGLGS